MKNVTSLRTRKSTRALAGSIAALLALHSAQAASIFWLGTTDGNFNANNWTGTSGAAMAPALVPLNNDVLNFDNSETNFAGTFAVNNDLTLTGLTLAITDNSVTDDFAISGNAISVGSGGIVSNVISGTGAALGFVGGITLDAAASFNAVAGILTITSGVDNAGNLLTVTGAGDTNIIGTITGAGGLTKTNAGALFLSLVNNYTGQTTVTQGTVFAADFDVLGTGAPLLVNGGTVDLATFDNTVGAVTLTSGSILGSGAFLTGTSFAVESGTVSARLAGSGIVLTKSTAGTVTLSGANIYTGGTNLNGGTLALGNAGALGSSGNITFGGGTLQFNTGSTPDFSARIKNSASAVSLDTNGQTVTFAGLIDSTNTGGLVKTGAGTLILSNPANTYTGNTTVSGGILQASRSGSGTFSFGGTLTLNNGSILHPNSGGQSITIPNQIILPSGSASIRADNANGNIANTDLIITGQITGSGGLTVIATNNGNRRKLELQTANPSFSGGVTLQQTVAPNGTFQTNTAAYTRVRLVIFDKAALGTGTLVSQLANVTGAPTGGLEVPNSNTSNAGTNYGLETGTGVTNAISIATSSNLSVTTSQTNALQLSGIISGAGSLTLRPPITNPINLSETNPNNLPGLLILTGANAYTGSTLVNAGTLQIGNGGTAGSLSPSSAIVVSNPNASANGATGTFNFNNYVPTLSFKRSDTLTQGTDFASGISGNLGQVAQAGTGITILNGTNTYTGATLVSAGVLRLESAGALPGGVLTAGGTSNLTFNGGVVGLGSGNSTFTRNLNTAATATAATFTGAGGWAAYGADATVNLSGGGTIIWNDANTGFNGQTLILGASSATHTVDLQNGIDLSSANRTLRVDDGGAATDGRLTGAITSAGGGLIKTGAGTLNLDNASQSYDALAATAGTTNVNGTLGTAPGLAAVTVSNAGTSLKFGNVSQTLSSLTIGAGAAVTFTSGFAFFSGGAGGKAPSFGGSSAVPEPGTIGLLLIGALGVLNRRRRRV